MRRIVDRGKARVVVRVVLGLVLISLSLPSAQRARAQVDDLRPNILIIMTDDQRAAGTYEVMPETMRIFRDGGTQYPNGIVTTPLCCPSRASFFSGQYAHNHGVLRNELAGSLDTSHTIQYQLNEVGYKTAIAGKYLNLWTDDPPHFDRWATFRDKAGYFDATFNVDGKNKIAKYSTHFIRNKAIAFVRDFERRDSRPWFMQVSPYAPHAMPKYPAELRTAALPAWTDTPANSEDDVSDKPEWVQDSDDSRRWAKRLRKHQLRSLMPVDVLVADLFSKLEAFDEDDDTLAFFVSDNGHFWYEHGLVGKGDPYDDAVRIPYFARWPGHIPAGATDPRIVANIDVAPTVYDAARVTPSYTVDGRSILSPEGPSYIFTEYFTNAPDSPPTWRQLWTPEWTYVRYDTGPRVREYYAPDDEWQLDNVYGDAIATNEPSNENSLDRALDKGARCAGASCWELFSDI
jgi:arylsulfatase A-like enzyme